MRECGSANEGPAACRAFSRLEGGRGAERAGIEPDRWGRASSRSGGGGHRAGSLGGGHRAGSLGAGIEPDRWGRASSLSSGGRHRAGAVGAGIEPDRWGRASSLSSGGRHRAGAAKAAAGKAVSPVSRRGATRTGLQLRYCASVHQEGPRRAVREGGLREFPAANSFARGPWRDFASALRRRAWDYASVHRDGPCTGVRAGGLCVVVAANSFARGPGGTSHPRSDGSPGTAPWCTGTAHAGQSAKADFVNFQRRIHSLGALAGLRIRVRRLAEGRRLGAPGRPTQGRQSAKADFVSLLRRIHSLGGRAA